MKYSFRSFVVIFILSLTLPTAAQPIAPFLPDDDLPTIRKKIKQNGYSFKVSDYSKKGKFSAFIPGRRPSSNMSQLSAKTIKVRNIPILDNLPERFDWRDVDGKSFIGPIRNQSNTGTCYAFGACAAAEGAFNKAANLFNENCIDFSEAYIAWRLGEEYPYSEHFEGSYGADYDYYELSALTQLGMDTEIEGVCLEQDFPFPEYNEPDENTASSSLRFPRFYFDNWSRIYPSDYEDTTAMIKSAMMTYGVIDTAVDVGSAFESYKEGIYEDSNTEPEVTPYYYHASNHAISLVGWDDNPPEGGGGCWILRNSWGPDWGEDGYMRIRYKSAGVNMFACYLAFNPNTVHAFTSSVIQTHQNNAIVSGFIKTGTSEVICFFEYGNSDNLAFQTDPITIQPSSSQSIVHVTDTLKGLLPDQSYSYRLVCQNSTDILYGDTDKFSTIKPVASVNEPEQYPNFLKTSFSIEVKTSDSPTETYIEYGISDEYGKKSQTITNLRDYQKQIDIQDLMPNTTYHYRLVASNIGGEFISEDFTFDSSENIFLDDDLDIDSGEEYFDDFDDFDDEDYEDYDEYDEYEGMIDWEYTSYLGDEEVYESSYDYRINQGNIIKISPYNAFSGQLNFLFSYDPFYKFEEDYTEEQGIILSMISPQICLSQFDTVFLHFYHAQPADGNDQDELRVYYCNEPKSEWQLLAGAEYLNHIPDWTKRIIELPALSPKYQIKFEITGNFGHGVLLDRIEILQSPEETSINNWSIY